MIPAAELPEIEPVMVLQTVEPAQEPSLHRSALVAKIVRLMAERAFSEAGLYTDQLIEQDPGHPHGHLLRSRLLKACGRPVEAEAEMALTARLFNAYTVRRLIERNFPLFDMMVQLTRTCNFRCAMCGHPDWQTPDGMMHKPVFDRTLEQCVDAGIDTMMFASAQGEPLLNVQAETFIAQAVARDLRVRIATNGSPLTARRAELLARTGLAEIQFSFAGYDRESYERIYVGGKFDRAVRNLTMLAEALTRYGAPTRLWVNGVVPQDDGEFSRRTLAFLQSLGITDVGLQKVNNFAGRNEGIAPTLARATARLCRLPAFGVGIYVDGTVTACGCLDANGDVAIGNILESSLDEIRRGPRLRAVLDAFLDGSIEGHPLCGGCDMRFLPLDDGDMTILD